MKIRVAIFDLEGTLIQGKSACELIAEPLGKVDRMSQLESIQSYSEVIHARREVASWYRGYSIQDLEETLWSAEFGPGVEVGISALQREGVIVCLASLTWEFAVSVFARRLSIDSWVGTEISGGRVVADLGPRDKGRFVREVIRKYDLRSEEVAAIGDSDGDVFMLQESGLPIFVGECPVSGLPERTLHMPRADLRVVADQIVPGCMSRSL